MIVSAFSPASIWASVTRTLTGFGTTALTLSNNVNVSLAANATANFQNAAGKASILTLAVKADASGTCTIVFTDATNAWTAVTVAAGTTGGQDFTTSGATVFWQIVNNSATVAAHYFTAGYAVSQ